MMRDMGTRWNELLLVPEINPYALREAFRTALQASGKVSLVSDSSEDPLKCEVRSVSGRDFSVQLETLYDAIRHEPPLRRESLVLQHVATAIDTARSLDGEAPAASTGDIVPTVKSAGWVADATALSPDLASEPIAADLVLVYAFDRPHSVAYASRADLQALGVSGPRLRATALANLRVRLPPQLGTRGDGKMFMFLAGGNFESSLILLDEVWDQLRTSLPGDPIVCVVARDVCLVTSTRTPGGVETLLRARDHLCSRGSPDHFISKTVLRRDVDHWVPFQQPS